MKNRAEFPWRPADLFEKRDPYAVWISETMLQQTQVSAIREAFRKWMEDFPTVKALAAAKEEDVLLHWQGLGYYSRARNLHKAAQKIAQNGGKFPTTRKELLALPGIGDYTAGAILSFAFHRGEPILDGNLVRIFSRIRKWNFLPSNGKAERNVYWEEAAKWANVGQAFLTNEALMELGRTVCKKTNPACGACPIRSICGAFIDNRTGEFPPRKKIQYESWTGFALVVCDEMENFLLRNSPDSPFFKNQPMFPLFECASAFREVFPAQAEDLISPEERNRFEFVGTVEHSITRYKIRCRVLCVEVKSREKIPGLWVSKQELSRNLVSSFARKILVLAHDF